MNCMHCLSTWPVFTHALTRWLTRVRQFNNAYHRCENWDCQHFVIIGQILQLNSCPGRASFWCWTRWLRWLRPTVLSRPTNLYVTFAKSWMRQSCMRLETPTWHIHYVSWFTLDGSRFILWQIMPTMQSPFRFIADRFAGWMEAGHTYPMEGWRCNDSAEPWRYVLLCLYDSCRATYRSPCEQPSAEGW